MIVAAGLRKAYGSVTALDGLSFEVLAGSVLALLGPISAEIRNYAVIYPANP